MTDSAEGIGVFRRFRELQVAAGLFACFLAMNPSIIADWRSFSFDDGSYSHAYLIPFLCAYLLWDAHDRQQLVFRNGRWLLPLLGLSLYALLVAQFAQFSFLERVLTPVPLLVAFLCVFRLRFAVVIPVVMLWFITPLWGVLNWPLQEASSRAVEAAMRLTHIPTYVDGNFVQIPAGTFEIAEGCSGLRYLVSALAIALVYCHLYLRSWRSMAVFTAIAVVGAILTNWVRILLLVLLGHYSDMQSEIIRDHNMFGWYLFIPFMVVLTLLGRRLEGGGWEQSSAAATGPAADKQRFPRTAFAGAVILLVLVSGVTAGSLQHGRIVFVVEPVRVDEMRPAALPEIADHPVLYGDFLLESQQPPALAGDFPVVRVFDFSGIGPVAKPDFYLNSVIPAGWDVCGSDILPDGALRYALCRGDETAVLDVLYLVGERSTARASQLRSLRLLQALSFRTGSRMYWWFVACSEHDCGALDESSPVAAL